MTDLAQIVITNIKSVSLGGDAIAGVKSATLSINDTVKEGTSDGAPGITSQDRTQVEIGVRLEFESEAPLVDLLTHAEGNLVITARKAGGTNRATTVKNVSFEGDDLNLPAANDTANATTSIDGGATWGSADTLATMITEV